MSTEPTVGQAIDALEARMHEAADKGEGVYAAELGVVLGALLERSQRPDGQARIARAMNAIDVGADLERPLRLAEAWRQR